MQHIPLNVEPPIPVWAYFDAIPAGDFADHDCSAGNVSNAWTDATGNFQHVLINTENKNIFMVIVLDLRNDSIFGHRLLDLNHEYGLECA